MLIVAQPKSASTALLVTLGKLHDLPASQGFYYEAFAELEKPRDLRSLADNHFDIRELEPNLVEKLTAPCRFTKHHIPPTPNNTDLLKGHRCVVLLRVPEEVVLAYRRGIEAGVHNPLEAFSDCRTPDEWLDRARATGLLDDLRYFWNGWRNAPGHHLQLTYSELIKEPTESVRRIEAFWDLAETQTEIRLVRKRYSRYGRMNRAIRGGLDWLADGVVRWSREHRLQETRGYSILRGAFKRIQRFLR